MKTTTSAESRTSIVIINETEIKPLVINEQRVLTLAMIDAIHGRPEGTAGRNFRENRDRLTEGEDYFKVCADEIRRHKIIELSSKAREDVTFLTESGYLLLVKSFTDDLAWRIQKQLIQAYFRTGSNVIGESCESLLPSEQQTLKEVAHRRLSEIHPSQHGKAMAEIWSRVQRKFRVAKYSQLPRTQLTDAIIYITKLELKAATFAQDEPEIIEDRTVTTEELEQIKTLVHGIARYFKTQTETTLISAIYRGMKSQLRIGSINQFPASRLDNALVTLRGIEKQAHEHWRNVMNHERKVLKDMGIPVS